MDTLMLLSISAAWTELTACEISSSNHDKRQTFDQLQTLTQTRQLHATPLNCVQQATLLKLSLSILTSSTLLYNSAKECVALSH